jgi:hypothetical protein
MQIIPYGSRALMKRGSGNISETRDLKFFIAVVISYYFVHINYRILADSNTVPKYLLV